MQEGYIKQSSTVTSSSIIPRHSEILFEILIFTLWIYEYSYFYGYTKMLESGQIFVVLLKYPNEYHTLDVFIQGGW